MDSTLKVIGITGGSGTGKSSVTRYFSQKNIAVIDADLLAREVVLPNTPCLAEITAAFGEDMLLPDGSLNRKKLGKLVFSNPDRLALLTSITQKYINDEILIRISAYQNNPVTLDKEGKEVPLKGVIIDAPLLFESGFHKICDAVVAVLADMDLRITRISQRDNISKEDAKMRIMAQKEDTFYSDQADFILYNNGDYDELYLQADIVLSLIL
jgi:dephospho-CoA kinase